MIKSLDWIVGSIDGPEHLTKNKIISGGKKTDTVWTKQHQSKIKNNLTT